MKITCLTRKFDLNCRLFTADQFRRNIKPSLKRERELSPSYHAEAKSYSRRGGDGGVGAGGGGTGLDILRLKRSGPLVGRPAPA